MYKLAGTDEKECGPFSLDELQQWIVGGGACGQTMLLLGAFAGT